jgi:hypothetical protein
MEDDWEVCGHINENEIVQSIRATKAAATSRAENDLESITCVPLDKRNLFHALHLLKQESIKGNATETFRRLIRQLQGEILEITMFHGKERTLDAFLQPPTIAIKKFQTAKEIEGMMDLKNERERESIEEDGKEKEKTEEEKKELEQEKEEGQESEEDKVEEKDKEKEMEREMESAYDEQEEEDWMSMPPTKISQPEGEMQDHGTSSSQTLPSYSSIPRKKQYHRFVKIKQTIEEDKSKLPIKGLNLTNPKLQLQVKLKLKKQLLKLDKLKKK